MLENIGYSEPANYNPGNKLMAKRQKLRESSISGIRKVLNLSLKAEIQLQNENHTEDWALGILKS